MNHSGKEDELVVSKDRVWVPSEILPQLQLLGEIGHTRL